MPISFCPNCDARITVGFDCSDYVHDCIENIEAPTSVTQEDIVITGNWEDYEGSGEKNSQQVLLQGVENQIWGTNAGARGGHKEAITERGVRASTHRQRSKLTYIDLRENEK